MFVINGATGEFTGCEDLACDETSDLVYTRRAHLRNEGSIFSCKPPRQRSVDGSGPAGAGAEGRT